MMIFCLFVHFFSLTQKHIIVLFIERLIFISENNTEKI